MQDFLTDKNCVFAVVGEEVGEKGTPHLQGFLHLRTKRTFNVLHQKLPGAHIEVAKGTDLDNLYYCKKGGKVLLEVGVPPTKSHSHHSLLDGYKLAELVADGADLTDLLDSSDEFKMAYGKHQRLVDTMITRKRRRVLEKAHELFSGTMNIVFFQWQAELYDELTLTEPHPRRIIWYIDDLGGAGKSTFASMFCVRNKSAVRFGAGKMADVAFSYQGERVVFFDIPRAHQDLFAVCSVMEDLKNGNIFSSKYESATKRFPPPHVVVFANENTPKGAFSLDRIERRRINI